MEDRSSLLKSMREALEKPRFDQRSDVKNQLSFPTILLSLFWIALLFVIFLSAFGAKAATVLGSQTITLDGRLTDSSGNNPLLDSSVVIDVKIYNPAATCVLYEEHQTVSTSSTDGRFTILVGSATGSSKRTGSDVGNPMVSVFANNQAIAGSCGIYTPAAGDARLMRVTVAPSTTGSTDVLSPDTILDQVPLALVAESLQGLDRDHVLAIDSSTTLNQNNVSNIFSATNYPILTSLLAGTNSQYVSSSASGGAKIPSVSAAPASAVAGQIWFNSSGNSFQYYNGSSVQTIGTSGAGISSLTVGSNLTAGGTAGGTLTGPGTIDIVNSGVTAGSYPKVTVNSKGLVTAGTTLVESDIPNLTAAGKVSGSAITSGTIGGTTSFYSSGNVTASIVSSGQSITRQIQLFDPANGSSHKITILAPTLTQDYSLVFPATAGSGGYALTTDGSGNLSWASSSAGSVTSVGLSLPSIFSVTTPTVTSSGTLTAALANQNANLIFAGPSTGTASVPTFRNLTIGDLPAGYDASVLKTALPSGKIWIGNASNLANAVTPFGDVTLSLAGSGTVVGLQGNPISNIGPTIAGQMLRWNGSIWAPNFVAMTDLRSSITGANSFANSCAANQTLTYNSVGDTMSCSNISIASSQVTWSSTGANLVFASPNGSSGSPIFRGIAAADLPLSGVAAGTYKSVTTDIYGRITTGTNPTTLTGFGITDAVQNLGGSPAMQSGADSAKPASTSSGTVYFATDTKTIYEYSSGAWLQLASNSGSGGTLNSLSGDVTTTGSGNVTASVVLVGGSSANAVHTAEQLTNNATSLNTINQIVKRDGSGNFAAGTATFTSAILNSLSFKNGSFAVSVSASPSLASNYSVVWPSTQGSAQQVMQTDGSGNLSWMTPSSVATSYSGILPVGNGGTGTATPPNQYGIMFASTSSGYATTNAGTAGFSLISNGGSSAPTFSQVPLATGVSGLLPVASGGTNTSSTSQGFIFAGPIAASGAPTFRAIASTDLPSNAYDQTYFKQGGNSFGSNAVLGTSDSNSLTLNTAGSPRLTITSSGSIGVGIASPTARLALPAGSSIAGTSPLKFTAGTLNTSAEPGSIEFDGTSIYFTDSTSTRRALGTAGSGIAQLIGDVTASGNGLATATVQLVGGSSANAVHTAELLANASTSLNTASTIVKRDVSGSFIAGTANLTSANVSSVVYRDSGSNTVTVSAPTAVGTSYAIRWPSNSGSALQVMQTDGSGNLSWTTTNSGSVTSVGLSLPLIFSVTTPVVTSSGTLTAALTNQNANLIFAAPSTGNGQPSFRNFVATDLPLSGVSTGTYSGLAVDSYGRVTNAATLTTLSGYGITDAVKNLGSTPAMQSGTDSAKPASPLSGTVYFATDTKTIYEYSSGAWLQLASNAGSGGTLNSLIGDVTTTGTGNVTATVQLVGGSSANAVHTAELIANAATNLNTASTIVKRDVSGNFIAGTANLTSANVSSVVYKGGANTVTVSASPSLTANYSVVWPTAQGSASQVMQTDGSGNLSWITPSSVATSYSGVLPFGNGGTGTSTPPTQYGVIFASTSSGYASTAQGGPGLPLLGQGAAAPVYGALSLSGSGVSGLLPVSAGGTNTSTTNAGYIFAGPATGGAAAPSFRSIASSDLPANAYDQTYFKQGGNSFGSAATVGTIDANSLTFNTANNARLTITSSGNIGVGIASSTARLMLPAGSTLAGTSPLKLTSGSVLTAPEAGAVEFDGTNLYFTDSGNIRRTLGQAGSGIAQLTGDVAASGNGSVSSVVNRVNGVTYPLSPSLNTVPVVTSANVVTYQQLPNAALQYPSTTLGSTVLTLGGTANSVSGLSSLGVGVNAATTGTLTFANGAAGGATTTITPSASTLSPWTLTLPPSGGSSGSYLQTNGSGVTSWVTPTGTGSVQSGLTNQIAYYGSAGTNLIGLASANNSVLLTNGSGVPAWNLSANDNFMQYAKLNGRAGGQTWIGGTGASESVTINSTSSATKGFVNLQSTGGNVGIGTSIPGALVDIASSSTGGTIARLTNSDTNGRIWSLISTGSGNQGGAGQFGIHDTTLGLRRMTIDTAGNVGIGTAAPQSFLDVSGTGLQSAILVPRDSTTNRPTGINGMIRYNTTSNSVETFANGAWNLIVTTAPDGGASQWTNNGSDISFNSGNVGIGTSSPAYLLDLNLLSGKAVRLMTNSGANGFIANPYGNFSIGTNLSVAGGLHYEQSGPATAISQYSGDINFQVVPYGSAGNSTTLTAAMTIKNNRSVGIGTTSPQAALDIYGTGISSAIVVPRDSTTNRPPTGINGMIRYATDTNSLESYVNGAWTNLSTAASGASQWSTSGTTIYYTGGSVGIGTNSTSANLHVNSSTAPSIALTNSTTNFWTLGGATTAGTYSAVSTVGDSVLESLSGNSIITNQAGGNITFATGTSVANDSVKLTILANGKTGIGTTSPTTGLQVATSISSGFGTGGGYGFTGQDGSHGGMFVNGASFNLNLATTGSKINFGDSTNPASFATFSSTATYFNEQVGIGTTAPQAILDVNGSGTSGSAMLVPRDSTTNRPTGINGMLRYNTSLSQMEMFASGNWSGIAAGSSSGSYLPLTGGILTGAVIHPYGTSSAPSISLADGVTGLYGTGAGNLSFATSGVQRMVLNPSGYVGIGTNTPNTNIAGLGTAVDIFNNLTNDTAVGNALNVYATTSSNKAFNTSLSAGNFQLDIGSINYPLFASAVIGLAKNGNNVQTVNGGTFTATSTTGYPTYLSGVSGTANVFNNSTIANISGGRFAAGVTSGSTATKALGLYSTVTGPGSITNGYGLYVDTVLGTNKFGVYENSGGTNYFAGNVGVGTSSPQAILDLVGSATTNSALIVPRATIAQRPTTAVNGMIRYQIDNQALEAYTNGAWSTLATSASGASQWTTSGSNIYFNSTGNVGIGTNAPISTLEVNGAARNSSSILNATSTVNFATGNLQYTASSCGTFSLWNLKDGGTYTFAVQGSTAGTCTFTAYSDSGSTSLTVKTPTDWGPTTTGKHTLFTIMVMGGFAYVAWNPGY